MQALAAPVRQIQPVLVPSLRRPHIVDLVQEPRTVAQSVHWQIAALDLGCWMQMWDCMVHHWLVQEPEQAQGYWTDRPC